VGEKSYKVGMKSISFLLASLLALPFACTPPGSSDSQIDAGGEASQRDVLSAPDSDIRPDVVVAVDAQGGEGAGVINSSDVFVAPSEDVSIADVAPLEARLVINEVMPRNDTVLSDEAGEFDDWIEIANLGNATALLDGLTLTDEGTTPSSYTFPNNTSLQPGAFLILFADIEPLQGPYHLPFRLDGGGETIVLADEQNEIDRFTFGALAIDQSAGRTPGSDEIVVLESPTPNAPNSGALSADGVAASNVVINEFVASNTNGLTDELGEFDDWIELFNRGNSAQDLSGHHLSDRESAPFLYTFPGGTILAPGGYLIIFADGSPQEGPFHAGFSLNANGESIIFSAPDGSTIDSVDFIAQLSDEASARVPNGSGNFSPRTPSPSASND